MEHCAVVEKNEELLDVVWSDLQDILSDQVQNRICNILFLYKKVQEIRKYSSACLMSKNEHWKDKLEDSDGGYLQKMVENSVEIKVHFP